VAIEDLIRRFNAYRLSHSKLLVEIARRRQYKEAAQSIVRSMTAQLEAMSDGMFSLLYCPARLFIPDDVPEERLVRESFNAEQGAHLPSDLCLYIENPPTRWQVIPLDGETVESLPDVDDDLVEEVGFSSISQGRTADRVIGQRRYCEGRGTSPRK